MNKVGFCVVLVGCVFLLASCSKTGEIRGKVIYHRNMPAASVVVYTVPATNSVLTDDNGEYGISKIQPDEYVVIARTIDFPIESVSTVVSVRKGEITTCDLGF